MVDLREILEKTLNDLDVVYGGRTRDKMAFICIHEIDLFTHYIIGTSPWNTIPMRSGGLVMDPRDPGGLKTKSNGDRFRSRQDKEGL